MVSIDSRPTTPSNRNAETSTNSAGASATRSADLSSLNSSALVNRRAFFGAAVGALASLAGTEQVVAQKPEAEQKPVGRNGNKFEPSPGPDISPGSDKRVLYREIHSEALFDNDGRQVAPITWNPRATALGQGNALQALVIARHELHMRSIEEIPDDAQLIVKVVNGARERIIGKLPNKAIPDGVDPITLDRFRSTTGGVGILAALNAGDMAVRYEKSKEEGKVAKMVFTNWDFPEELKGTAATTPSSPDRERSKVYNHLIVELKK